MQAAGTCHFERFTTWLAVNINFNLSYSSVCIYWDMGNHWWLASQKLCPALYVRKQSSEIWKTQTHQRCRRHKAIPGSGRGPHQQGRWLRPPVMNLDRRWKDALGESHASHRPTPSQGRAACRTIGVQIRALPSAAMWPWISYQFICVSLSLLCEMETNI